MTRITRIAGSPGAGKTHQLKQYLKRERDENGVDVSDFYYLTFTTAGTDDAREEVQELFDVSDKMIKGCVRTLHSAAHGEALKAGIIEDHDKQIITHSSERGKEFNIYREFATEHGLSYYGRDLRDQREQDTRDGNGDLLFRLNEWLTLTGYDYEQARLAPMKLPWPTPYAVDLLKQWNEYKRTARPLPRFEHFDYLDKVIERELFPEVSVLLLDEFQDFSPQEYLYYRKWRDSGRLDRIYLAGDSAQSIYSFRAGDPYYFEETDADDDVELTESHRCRTEIATYAASVLNSGPRDSVNLTSAFDGGRVRQVDGNRDSNLKAAVESALSYDDGGFLLARTNGKVHSIMRRLNSHGYPHRALGKQRRSVWTESLEQSLGALRTLQRRSGGVDRDAANTLLAHAPQSDLRKSLLESHGDVYSVESVWKAFSDKETVGGIVETLDYDSYERTALRNAAQTDCDADDLHVGTIHAAKGLERPCVLLFNSLNGYIEQQYNEDMDTRAEEHRIAYVGATRASKRLYVVDGFFNGPKMPPLEKARTGVVA